MNVPRWMRWPNTVIFADQVFEAVLCTPLYLEEVGLDCFFLFHAFWAAVAGRRLAVRLSRPTWLMWSQSMSLGIGIMLLCIGILVVRPVDGQVCERAA